MAAPIIHAGHMPTGFCLGPAKPLSPVESMAKQINDFAIANVIKTARNMAGNRGINRELIDHSFAANVLVDLPMPLDAEVIADRIADDLDAMEGRMT